MNWNKIKWYVYGALFILAVATVYILSRGNKDDSKLKALNKWINDKRSEIVKQELNQKVARQRINKQELDEIESKLEEIEKERQASGDEEHDEKSMQELADIYKEISGR